MAVAVAAAIFSASMTAIIVVICFPYGWLFHAHGFGVPILLRPRDLTLQYIMSWPLIAWLYRQVAAGKLERAPWLANASRHWHGCSMSSPSPLSQPEPWNLVSPGYVDILLPEFTKYARHALEKVGLDENAHVLDVATGPGTCALLAAALVKQVTAIDFAHDMLNAARKRAAGQGLRNVEFHEGDAQTLPFADNTFDAAFSIFGLIFFPDRIAGLKEMRRVLKPSGKVGLTSWVPFKEVPLIEAVFTVIGQHLSTPFGSDGPPPLGTPELIREEFGAAGFADIDVTRIENTVHESTLHAYWESMVRSTAPLTLLRKRMGDAWGQFEKGVFAELLNRFGAGPVTITMPAWLTVASKT